MGVRLGWFILGGEGDGGERSGNSLWNFILATDPTTPFESNFSSSAASDGSSSRVNEYCSIVPPQRSSDTQPVYRRRTLGAERRLLFARGG